MFSQLACLADRRCLTREAADVRTGRHPVHHPIRTRRAWTAETLLREWASSRPDLGRTFADAAGADGPAWDPPELPRTPGGARSSWKCPGTESLCSRDGSRHGPAARPRTASAPFPRHCAPTARSAGADAHVETPASSPSHSPAPAPDAVEDHGSGERRPRGDPAGRVRGDALFPAAAPEPAAIAGRGGGCRARSLGSAGEPHLGAADPARAHRPRLGATARGGHGARLRGRAGPPHHRSPGPPELGRAAVRTSLDLLRRREVVAGASTRVLPTERRARHPVIRVLVARAALLRRDCQRRIGVRRPPHLQPAAACHGRPRADRPRDPRHGRAAARRHRQRRTRARLPPSPPRSARRPTAPGSLRLAPGGGRRTPSTAS